MARIFMAGSPNDGVAAWRQILGGQCLEQSGHEVLNMVSMKEMSPEQVIGYYASVLTEWKPDIIVCGRLDRTTVSLFRRSREYGVKGRVWDIDDLLHDLPDDNPAAKRFDAPMAGHRKIYDAIMGVTDVVMTTTPFLQKFYTNWKNGLGPEAIIAPNVISHDTIVRQPPMLDKRLRVGFVYNTNRHGDFISLLPMLREMIEDGTIHLTLFGSFPEEFWGVSPKGVRWVRHCPALRYWHNLGDASVDVVLSRLNAHDFNAAKSNIKWLEATMAGAVSLCTNFGEMAGLPGSIQMPVDDTPEMWREALKDLAQRKAGGTLTESVEESRAAVERDWMTSSPSAIAKWQKVVDHVELRDRDRLDGDASDGNLVDDVPADEGERS